MKKTIAKVGYFTIAYASGVYTYGAPTWFESAVAGGREFSASPRGETTEVYADGKRVIAVNDNDGYDCKLQLLDIIDNIEKDWLGRTVETTTSNVAEYSDGAEFPKFGLAVVYEQRGGGYETEWYYQCQVSKRPEKTGKTSEGKFEAQFFDVEITASPREHDEGSKLVCYTSYTTTMPTTTVALPVAVEGGGT